MPLIDWIPSYNIGVAEIDIDNQQLVGMINHLHDSISKQNNNEIVNQVICQIAQNFQDHCTVSTHELQKINYPALALQQESHKKFGRVVAMFLQRMKKEEKISTMEVIGFLRNWFDKHVLVEDQKIKTFIRQKKKKSDLDADFANSNLKKIEWEDSYSFDHKKIDEQHQGLVNLYNKLYHAVELKMSKEIILKIVDAFRHHAIIHFKDEEQLMADCKYSDYEEHAKIHKQLIKEFEYFLKRINNDDSISHIKILKFIHNWFINHLLNEDKKLFYCLKGSKVMADQA